ncbi:tRNA wybutosine-synthesizing protein 1 [Cladophialophora carrionii]|uniref:S-adenosyl-L-methionine-dependent tRNA 4-demethylwyosine synthase n=1 Tax=Cladophialophora carrionii TaxID=86049 RepID=A0A1C1C8M6_9EURO|nr:tRNA wybutosine-synthesizing protein 1 [Cladophialophora carrionii]
MDMGEDAAPVILADWLDRLLTSWHDHRILLASALVLSVLAIIVRRRRAARITLRDSSPGLEKADWLAPDEGAARTATNEKNETASIYVDQLTSGQARKPRPAAARVVTGRKPVSSRGHTSPQRQTNPFWLQPLVFFSSLTGTTEQLSKKVAAELETLATTQSTILKPEVYDLSYIDLDDYFISGPKTIKSAANVRYFYLLLIPSYDIDTILNTFLAHLDETHNDFRIDTAPLASLAGYTVFGIGDKEGWPTEEKGFCSQAVEVDRWMAKLTGRKRAYPLGLGDVKSNIEQATKEWTGGVCDVLQELRVSGTLGDGVPGSGAAVESDQEDEPDAGYDNDDDFPDSGRNKRRKLANTADLEDVGGKSAPMAIDFTTYSTTSTSASVPLKAMVPKESPTHAALTKQGYTIVGTHSGVKICRWTKSALRGRGSCYKNSFYGIASHLCMETTPSLSCSNKCVFCWRHGTNPVSTTWRWQVDDPKMIFDGAKEGHYKKIKMMRGVPGVRSERFEEAMRIRHCALSLVGEPIFYPRINEFVGLLHGDRISSFLVCNAQHPQQLNDLRRVTQLYVSIDASNRDSLRKIDRPLHRDFWERFNACLDILRAKRFEQRTVFRLTLVKGFNVEDEVEGYADLVAKGLPCFIEIKGVTYCGTSTSSSAGLTMQNVPFYEEVVAFVEALNTALARRGLGYGIAAEHAHSCCALIASNRFLIDGKWHTIIDYDRFFALLQAGQDFKPEDYCKETPEWALWGNGGFDPRDERVDRKGKPIEATKADEVARGRKTKTGTVVAVQSGGLDF